MNCHAEHTVSFTGARLGRDTGDGGKWEPCESATAAGLPHYENVQVGVTDDGKPIVRPELRGRRICRTPAEAQKDMLLYGDYFTAGPALLGEEEDVD